MIPVTLPRPASLLDAQPPRIARAIRRLAGALDDLGEAQIVDLDNLLDGLGDAMAYAGDQAGLFNALRFLIVATLDVQWAPAEVINGY